MRRFEQVVVCGGHMIDKPGRKPPRFPAAKAESVRALIAEKMQQWQLGEYSLVLCGGASGADILCAEESLRRGASLRLLLAQPPDDFVRASVQPAGHDWVGRFFALGEKAEVKTLPAVAEEADLSIYERVNLWLVENGREAAGETGKLCALLIWDEQPSGDGRGGTSDLAQRISQLGGEVAVINPTKL
ncbi:MAG: hypothetical protein M3R10_02095 [Verrucomicrobiota bacterium]|nr:hypothetical protein [Verrucomicrobiota bacterium]